MSQDWGAGLRLGVVGHPVEHSRSPRIHELFAKQFGLPLEYPLFDVLPADFAAFVKHREEAHQSGMNVTLPHKQAAHALCEVLTDRAWQAGAVNTLWWEGHVLHGDNTDGIGLVRDLTLHQGVELKGKRIMVVGAGGACRGIGFSRVATRSPRHSQRSARASSGCRSPHRRAALGGAIDWSTHHSHYGRCSP